MAKEINEIKKGALDWLRVIVDAFNLRVPADQKVRFVWGYSTETGLKEIKIASIFSADDHQEKEMKDTCTVFNTLYKEFSLSGCEVAFFFITDEKGWFKEMKISSVSLPLFESLENRGSNARKLIEEAKKEHIVVT